MMSEINETENVVNSQIEEIDDTTGKVGKADIFAVLKYVAIFMIVIVFWEFIMAIIQGSLSFAALFFLFFVPAQALFFASLCGIGNNLSSRITFPIVLFLPTMWYIAQIVYLKNFGSLFSVSMAGMGNDAVGNFGWAVIDAVESAVILIILVLVPIIAAIVLVIKNVFKLGSYKWWLHFVTLVASVVMWLLAVLCIRMFGTQRLSPYYLLTNSTATTDSAAHKLGVMTTGVVEAGSYYFGIGTASSGDFSFEEEYEYVDGDDIIVEVLSDGFNKPATNTQSGDPIEEKASSVPWINDKIDFNKVISSSVDDSQKNLASYLQKRGPSTQNSYTGMFEGYNLIYICAESFWSYGCNEDVTPTLYKMANNGIVLNNFYNSFYNTTTNGEFAFSTSLWPDVSRNSKNGTDIGSFAQSASKYMPQGLGDLFTENNIPSYAFHNYYGKYYRRILSWPNLGYKCRFTGDNMWFTSNWPASDLELMEQTVDDYIGDEQFNAYYMTFSGHGPYTSKNQMFNKNIGAVTAITGESRYNSMARGYLAGELELDRAMEYLLKRLEEAGQADKTVIVIIGDHYPYYLDKEGRNSLVGSEMDENFDIYHSNCIIYNSGMIEPLYVDSYCSNIDIAPTILNLFNIPFDSRLMIGRDIFSDEAHNRATLANMSFITDDVRYNYETGEAFWSAKGNQLSDADKDKYIESQLNSIENEYNAACRIIEDNFYFDLYALSGMLTDEEIAEEKSREARVVAQDADYNEQDEAEKAEKEAQAEAQRQLELQKEALRVQGFTDEQIEEMINTGTMPAINNDEPQEGVQETDPNEIPVNPEDVVEGTNNILVDDTIVQPITDVDVQQPVVEETENAVLVQ